MSVFWLRVAAALYSIGLLHALVVVLRRSPQLSAVAASAFSLGVTFHLVSLVEQTWFLGHLPADNFQETASLLAFLIAIAFQFVAWKYQFQSLSIFLFPLVFMMTLVGATEVPLSGWADQRMTGAPPGTLPFSYAPLPHTPAKQSACSSSRTEYSLALLGF